MLLIECPWCGPRDEVEFHYGGEAGLSRPDPDAVNDAAWAHYLFVRENQKGWMREHWAHARGCGQWFDVLRHTVTHEIRALSEVDR